MTRRNAQATQQLRKLENSYERQARILTGDPTLNVKVGGHRSCFDGQTVYVATATEKLSKEDREKAEGTLDHEIGHKVAEDVARGRQTAGLRVPTPLELLRSKGSKKESLLLNAFEDVRIEREQTAKLPGSGENIKRSNILAAQDYVAAAQRGENPDFWQCIAAAIIFGAYGFDVNEWLPAALRPVIDRIRPEINAAMGAKWVEDADELAKAVLRKIDEIKDEIEEAQQDAKEAGDDSQGSGEGGEGSDSAEGDAGDEGGENGSQGSGSGSDSSAGGSDDSEQGEDSGKGSQGDSEGQSGAGGNGDENANDLGDVDELAEAMKGADGDAEISDLQDRIRDELEEKCRDAGRGAPSYTASPKAIAGDRWIEIPAGDSGRYAAAKAEVASQISTMRAKLVAELRAKSEKRFVGDKTRGAIDAGSLYRLRMGSKRVFATQTQELTEEVAVSILVDQSGSMCGSKIEAARASAIAIGETLHALGVSFEIVGFNNHGLRYADHDRDCDRNESFHFHAYKTFDQSFTKRKTSLVNMDAGGGNNDGEAVLAMAKRLAVRSETRKILIVLSDGRPVGGRRSMGGGRALCEEFLSESVAKIAKAGIEIYGIGVQTPVVEKFYNPRNGSAFVVVDKIEDLATKVFGLLKGKLLRKGRAA